MTCKFLQKMKDFGISLTKSYIFHYNNTEDKNIKYVTVQRMLDFVLLPFDMAEL